MSAIDMMNRLELGNVRCTNWIPENLPVQAMDQQSLKPFGDLEQSVAPPTAPPSNPYSRFLSLPLDVGASRNDDEW